MDLTKEQEEKMEKVIKETKERLMLELIDGDTIQELIDDDAIQVMVEKIFGKIGADDDEKWVLCCNELVDRILK